jgi:AraC family transcriptional regulator, positive regulator of tynA and feaB
MLEICDFAGTPQLDYEAWIALTRSDGCGETEVSEPHAFAGWFRPLSVCGVAAVASKIRCGSGAMDLGCNAFRFERTRRDVRRSGAEVYWAVFQFGGRSEFLQNDQAIELAVGDVALVDTSRPATFANTSSAQCLSLHLPRQTLVSHLGFEPQGGFRGRSATLATRLLLQLVREGVEDEASLSTPSSAYMRLAVYDLIGALFAPSDPLPRHADKLFARICSIVKDRFADPGLGPVEIAAEAGISLRYLQKLFTARGSTCIHFIQSLRLEHAARLLQRRALLDTGRPLSEIAYACGFRDYSYFSRKFHRRFGYPPGAHTAGHAPRAVSLVPALTDRNNFNRH